jgi:hypothetical protein
MKWKPDKLTASEERIVICWYIILLGLCFFAFYGFEIIVSPMIQGRQIYLWNLRLLPPFAVSYVLAAVYLAMGGHYKHRLIDVKAIKWDLAVCGALGALVAWWSLMVLSKGMALDPDYPSSAPYPWRAIVHGVLTWCSVSAFLSMLAFLVFRRGFVREP